MKIIVDNIFFLLSQTSRNLCKKYLSKIKIFDLPNISFPRIAVALNVAMKWKSWKKNWFQLEFSHIVNRNLCPWFNVLAQVVRVKTGEILRKAKM